MHIIGHVLTALGPGIMFDGHTFPPSLQQVSITAKNRIPICQPHIAQPGA